MQLLRARPCNFNSAPDFLAYNWGMYQVIDEQDEDDVAQHKGWSVLPFVIGAILAGFVFFGVWLFSPGQQTTPGRTIETPASRAAYLKALAEPRPAIRRARLLDYQRVHPDTDRTDAIEDQLDVINTAELNDWETLVQAIYSETMALDDRQLALQTYESRWNGDMLGGRGDELTALKQILDDTVAIDALPDRSLEEGKSPISNDIPSDVLAGAPPQMAVLFPIEEPEPVAPEIEEVKDVIVQPRVRRNVSPNYPKSAKRRKIGAIVTITMDIDEDGNVEEAELVEIEAERYEKDFVKAARRAAKRTRFHPKTINGKPVAARDIRKRYIFRSN